MPVHDVGLVAANFSSRRRNHMLSSHRRDELIAWMKEMLHHSFVLDAKYTYFDTFRYFEELVDEHRKFAGTERVSRLRVHCPSVMSFHTPLPLCDAFKQYDEKYAVTSRRHTAPTFNEIRHTINLAQVKALQSSLRFISFDGDQTLYEDGGNFERDSDLSIAIRALLTHGVYVALITAAGYGHDGARYEGRLRGLIDGFIESNLEEEALGRFYVVGGECNYYLRCARVDGTARLVKVEDEAWKSAASGPRPLAWPDDECKRMLDIAEASMQDSIQQLRLRARLIRKARGIGIIPGGAESIEKMPVGHGSLKLKREALDEIVLRVQECMQAAEQLPALPYCCFNGGQDAWMDIGNKRVGVEAMQALLHLEKKECLHVGDQFLNLGNDHAARESCPCIWIVNPRETEKILSHVLIAVGLKAPGNGDAGHCAKKLKSNGVGSNYT